VKKLKLQEFSSFDPQADLFDFMREKRLFLSGGTGFFGKWLLESFLYLNKTFDLNAQMTVLSRDPESFLSEHFWLKDEASVCWVRGDVRTFEFPEDKFDFVIHGATEASLKLEQENPEEMRSVIVDGTQRMLGFAAQSGVSRFMMTSSGAVYGPQSYEMSHIPEVYSGMPETTYGKGKLLAEKMCVEAGDRGGFTVSLPRCFAFVGPYLNLDIHFAIGNFIRDCLENRPIIIKGDGTPMRSYLYAADLAEWLWTILLSGVHGRHYNVGSDQAISILELAKMVRNCAGSKYDVRVMQNAIQGQLPPRYVPSIERARNELGLGVRTPLQDAVCRTLDFERSRG
jgi:dTDP-glucose 4,6-dehydratase